MMESETYFAWYRLRGLGLVCLCSLVFFFGAYLANERSLAVSGTANVQMTPIERVQTEEKRLALTFDTAEGSVRTILKILEKCGVKADFFVTENWAEAHPDEVAAIAAAGHELGNRGTDRRSMAGLSRAEAQEELRKVHRKVQELTGVGMKLFRAPYGEYDDRLIEAVCADGYLPVRWSIDSEDWKDYGVESILRSVTQSGRLEPGAIIRMHSGAEFTANALEALIGELGRQGYELVPISQLGQP